MVCWLERIGLKSEIPQRGLQGCLYFKHLISLDPFYSTESTSSVIKTLDPQLSGPSASLVETEDTSENIRKGL